jgi:hypothetical protein
VSQLHRTMTAPQAHHQEPQWDTGYEGGYSGHQEGGGYYLSNGYLEPSFFAETSASARYPDWYTPLKQYVICELDQA